MREERAFSVQICYSGMVTGTVSCLLWMRDACLTNPRCQQLTVFSFKSGTTSSNERIYKEGIIISIYFLGGNERVLLIRHHTWIAIGGRTLYSTCSSWKVPILLKQIAAVFPLSIHKSSLPIWKRGPFFIRIHLSPPISPICWQLLFSIPFRSSRENRQQTFSLYIYDIYLYTLDTIQSVCLFYSRRIDSRDFLLQSNRASFSISKAQSFNNMFSLTGITSTIWVNFFCFPYFRASYKWSPAGLYLYIYAWTVYIY